MDEDASKTVVPCGSGKGKGKKKGKRCKAVLNEAEGHASACPAPAPHKGDAAHSQRPLPEPSASDSIARAHSPLTRSATAPSLQPAHGSISGEPTLAGACAGSARDGQASGACISKPGRPDSGGRANEQGARAGGDSAGWVQVTKGSSRRYVSRMYRAELYSVRSILWHINTQTQQSQFCKGCAGG